MTKRTFLTTLFGGAGVLAAASQLRFRKASTNMNTDTSPVTVRLLDESGALTAPISVRKVVKSDAAWRAQLTDEQFRVTRTEGTERAFCGIFHDNHKAGIYTCVGCGLPLFRSDAKFESGTGWPSFFQPVAKENIGETRDVSFGMARTEVHCVRCDSHFGHVFDDGPAPTGLRYCMNSASMSFREDGQKPAREKVLFGAGCFWGVEADFAKVKGVTATRVGYSGGVTKNPTYEDVCSHTTGHAEVVEVEYDPVQLSFAALLDVFWESHNPTTGHRQGPDVGSQYRSTIFFTTPEQEATARASAARLEKSGKLSGSITTEIALATPFYAAEDYHQSGAREAAASLDRAMICGNHGHGFLALQVCAAVPGSAPEWACNQKRGTFVTSHSAERKSKYRRSRRIRICEETRQISMFYQSILRRFTKFACLLVLGVGLAAQAHAQSKSLLNLDKSGVAVQGYDVVAYFTDGKPAKGNPQFASSHGGGTYHFASAEHKAAFDKEPARYAPQFGGYCAWAVAKDSLAKIEPDAFQIVGGRLLLQYDRSIRDTFSKDTAGNLAKADENWPGLIAKNGK